MKKISSLFLMLFAMSAVMLSACSDDSNPNPLAESNGTLNISTTELMFGVEGGEATFTVQGGTAFVRSEADWLTVARISGDKKSSSFLVTCEKNQGEERQGTVLANLNGAYERIQVTQSGKIVKPEESYSFRTAKEIAKDMYPGWNLGNTMEATGDGLGAETSWQKTKTTQDIIDYVKSQGFKSVRIPCSWYIHSTNGKIDAEWMERVQEVVDYCINAGLYVVLNDHWDNGWIEVDGFSMSRDKYVKVDDATISEKSTMLKTIWTQIANAFQNYDEHLLFAGLNEPFQEYTLFNNRHAEVTPVLLKYNQAFVDAVRATGGNNANRSLVVQAPATSTSSACESYFTLPTDEADKRLMVEVHFYDPWNFAGQTDDNAVWFWGEGNKGTGHNPTYNGDESYVKSVMQKLNQKFYANGVPVILGEFGAQWREIGDEQSLHDKSITAWYKSVVAEAGNNGVVPMVWDINSPNRGGKEGTMTIIDRSNKSIFNQPALDGITEGVKAASWK
ncbi:MAG: cellulase family glycosylhydrolase [Prevotella sp.]